MPVCLHVLGADGLQQVHRATLQLLQEVGLNLTHPTGREMLRGQGVRVEGPRVRLPADLVERCLGLCPPTVRLQGRDPDRAVVLGDGSWHAHNVGGVPEVLEDGERRPALRQDVADAARLLDALPHVSTLTPFFTPQDVPAASYALWMYADTVAHTTKPVHGPGVQTAREVRVLAELAAVACPEGTLSLGISPVSPLFFPDDVVEAMLETALLGLPLGPLPCPIVGASAPMSLAGALVQQNAELLGSIVLAQLARPGLPITYCGRLSVMNPRSGLAMWGNPEIGLVSAATVELGHHYGLPVNVYGLCTDAHGPDVQSGYERALNALVPVLAGADEISGVGEIWGGVVSSFAQMVLDDEVLAYVERLRRGIDLDEDSLALEVMARVMDGPRNFMGERHTLRYLQAGEVLWPRLSARSGWREWEAAGRPALFDRAGEAAAKLLAEHQVEPLSEQQWVEMERLIRAVETESEGLPNGGARVEKE
ncbi:MAG: trimethylamine methyltransferase family protein [Chloroflexia bacterium]|nr:trimethylamine methyltransferase family protein [Chloroflexia bacterium]